MYDTNNIFARILRGEIPCSKVYENEHALAFKDIQPRAPVHILVIPKGAYVSVADFSAMAPDHEIAAFHRAVAAVIEQSGLGADGFRVISNTGINGGQEVPHYHLHILGGCQLGPMVSPA